MGGVSSLSAAAVQCKPARSNKTTIHASHDTHITQLFNQNIYLDGLGESPSSPRRSSVTGLQTHYILPSGSPAPPTGDTASLGDTIHLILLDGRYERETLPCGARGEWCASLLSLPEQYPPSHPDHVWCRDLLVDGGVGGEGSCCRWGEGGGR